jgi:glyoxylase-like metal-dependent hydrolase (beta-lactamase superfamily II)
MNAHHSSISAPPHTRGLYRFGIGQFAAAVIGESGEGVGADRACVLFVDTGRQRVLFDVGEGPSSENANWWLVENLARAGVGRAEIDLVVISHAHGENVLGLADARRNPVFPNARYLIHRREWGAWGAGTHDPADGHQTPLLARRTAAARMVVADRVSFIRPGDETAPGILALDARGHTHGHLAFVISSNGETLVHTADIMCGGASQFHRPERDVAADADCLLGAVTRVTMLAQLSSDRCLTFAPRATFPGLGYVVRLGSVFRWRPLSEVGSPIGTGPCPKRGDAKRGL